MSAHSVPAAEVAELLRRAIRGEVAVTLANPEWSWSDATGDCGFRIDGWEVVMYNDFGDLDYVDSVRAPDGRTGDFDYWFGNLAIYGSNPAAYLSQREDALLLDLLEKAR